MEWWELLVLEGLLCRLPHGTQCSLKEGCPFAANSEMIVIAVFDGGYGALLRDALGFVEGIDGSGGMLESFFDFLWKGCVGSFYALEESDVFFHVPPLRLGSPL